MMPHHLVSYRQQLEKKVELAMGNHDDTGLLSQ